MADARLLVTTTGVTTHVTEIEVSHEALIRHWPRLRTWLDEDRESWMLLVAVRRQAREWEKRGKMEVELPRWGERLQKAEALFGLERFSQSKLEQEFLRKAKALAERERKEKEAQERREREALKKALQERERAENEKARAEKNALEARHQLALTHWNNAMGKRENENQLEAAHYFAQASQTFSAIRDHKAAANANLALRFILDQFPLRVVVGNAEDVYEATLSQDSKRILTRGDGTVRVWNSGTGEALIQPLKHGEGVWGATFIADGSRILTWNHRSVRVWDSGTGEALIQPLKHGGEIHGVAINADGSRILTWDWNDGAVRMWDSGTGMALIQPLKHGGEIHGAAFNADGSRILTWGDGAARVWDSGTGEALIQPLKYGGEIDGAAFNADGSRILTWGDGAVRVWDSGTGEAHIQPLKHGGDVWGAAFIADGSRILTWGDGAARVWDSGTGEVLMPLEYEGKIDGAAFNEDESRIVTWCRDGTVRLWDIAVDTAWPEDKIVLKTEVMTGTILEPTGELKALGATAWQEKKWCEYDKILHDLKRTTPEQWQTSQRLCRELKERNEARRRTGLH